MGYETRLLIGRRTNVVNDEHSAFFHIYAQIDLCKMGDSCALSQLEAFLPDDQPPVAHWFLDGDTCLNVDRYDAKPRPLPIKIVAEAARKDAENDEYRRFKWAAALLTAMADDKEGLEVLFYGH